MANKKVNQLTSKPAVNLTDLFLIADPTSGQAYKTTISDLGTAIGSGVSSVNSLVGAVVLDTDDIQELVSPTNKWFTDTRARAALSASSPLTYNSGTGAFGIQVANGSQNGYLSSADWTTFNSKQAALSGTGFVKSTGGTISYDNSTYLTTSAAASTYLALAGGTMTGVLFGTSASFSGYVGFNGNTSPLYPVDVDGSGRFSGDLRIESTNPRIYLTDTDNNPDYFISNTDGTFTIYDVTNSTARFTIGTTGNATFTNAITGGGSITGQSLYSNGIISAGSSVSATSFILTGGTGNTGLYYGHTDRVVLANYTAGGIDFEVNGGSIVATLFPSGNFGLGISLDAGYKLDVNGTARISGALSGTTISTSGSATFGSDVFTYANGGIFFNGGGSYGSGIFQQSGGTLALQTGGSPRLTISSTGAATFSSSVTANGSLTINEDGAGTKVLTVRSNWAGVDPAINVITSNALLLMTANTERMRITSSGNVGIGTTSPSNRLHVVTTSASWGTLLENNSKSSIYLSHGDGYGIAIDSAVNTSSIYTFKVAGGDGTNRGTNEYFRITGIGNVNLGVNTSTSIGSFAALSIKLGTAGTLDALAIQTGNNGNNTINWYNASGTYVSSIVINSSTVMYNTVSDYRLKEDLKSFKGLDLVSKINVYDYKWKSDGTRMYGVVAHELQEVLPDAVSGLKDAVNPDGTIKNQGVDYSKIVPVMVQAIKDLKAELDTLKNK